MGDATDLFAGAIVDAEGDVSAIRSAIAEAERAALTESRSNHVGQCVVFIVNAELVEDASRALALNGFYREIEGIR